MNANAAGLVVSARCPCHSGLPYGDCCGPLHAGDAAPDCEHLMRSRYAAYVLQRPDYLLRTWHFSTRPERLDLDDSPAWTSLQVFSSNQKADRGQVHFRAIYRGHADWQFLEEISDFCLENDRWFYLSGIPSSGSLKPGRNEPCPCGSKRKFKACCL